MTASWNRFCEFVNLCANRAKRVPKELPMRKDLFNTLCAVSYAIAYYSQMDYQTGGPKAEHGWAWECNGARLCVHAPSILPRPDDRLVLVNPLLVNDPWLPNDNDPGKTDIHIIYPSCDEG